MAQEQQAQTMQPDDIILELSNRLRVLESKNSMLGERLLIMNQNMIGEYKNLIKEIKNVNEDVKDLRNDLNNVKNILKRLTEEAADFAKKDNIKILEKYINLWNPLNFTTTNEVKKIIEEELKKRRINARTNTPNK